MSSRDALAALVWAEIAATGHSQADIAGMAGITQKHLSQIVNGHSGSLHTIDRVLAVLGRELVLSTRVPTEAA